MHELKEGDKSPEFVGKDENGNDISITNFK